MPGLSCVGIQVRVRIAWPCENRYGCRRRGLRGRQPLERFGVGRRAVAHHHGCAVGRQPDGQRAAEDRVGGPDGMQWGAAGIGDRPGSRARACRARPRGRRRAACNGQRRTAFKDLAREVRAQVQRDVRHASLVGPGVAMGIGHGRRVDRDRSVNHRGTGTRRSHGDPWIDRNHKRLCAFSVSPCLRG